MRLDQPKPFEPLALALELFALLAAPMPLPASFPPATLVEGGGVGSGFPSLHAPSPCITLVRASRWGWARSYVAVIGRVWYTASAYTWRSIAMTFL